MRLCCSVYGSEAIEGIALIFECFFGLSVNVNDKSLQGEAKVWRGYRSCVTEDVDDDWISQSSASSFGKVAWMRFSSRVFSFAPRFSLASYGVWNQRLRL